MVFLFAFFSIVIYNVGMYKKRRLQTIEQRLNKYINKTATCWLWTQDVYNYGYGKLSVGKGKQVRVHRYMYEKYKGEIPNGMSVLHTCDTPRCCNPEHLFLGTQTDNMRDAKQKNRIGYKVFHGENHPLSKVTMKQVEEIKDLYKTGNYYQRELGEKYGISQACISRILLGLAYTKKGETLVRKVNI